MRSEALAVVLAAGCARHEQDAGAREDTQAAATNAAAIELAKLARAGDAAAGALACDVVRQHPVDPREPKLPELVTTAYAVIAVTRTECAELAAALVDAACDARLDCGKGTARGLCTAEELQPEVDRVLDELVASGRFPDGVEDRHLLLAAGLRLPALPGRVRKQSDRRRYSVVQPDAPPCATPSEDLLPCKCVEDPDQLAVASCASSHDDEHDTPLGCRIRVDDTRRELVVLGRTK
jgi:hypothetical protein